MTEGKTEVGELTVQIKADASQMLATLDAVIAKVETLTEKIEMLKAASGDLLGQIDKA